MPAFNFVPPPSPSYLNAPNAEVLTEEQFPEIYTTTGPLAIENGLVVTRNAMAFDPNYVTEGNFDCGVFGSLG